MKKLAFALFAAVLAAPAFANEGVGEGAAELLGYAAAPEAICEGPALCRQVEAPCVYRCYGPAGGLYEFLSCSGQVGFAGCLFQGGETNCTVRCVPNPF